MTMAEDKWTDDDDLGLEEFFEAARRAPPAPSEALMARVGNDALAQQALSQRRIAEPETDRRGAPGVLIGLLRTIGGWPAVAGLACATLAGVWIGVTPGLGVADAVLEMIGRTDRSVAVIVDYPETYGLGMDMGEAG